MARLRYSTSERAGKENRRENNKCKKRKKCYGGKQGDRLKKNTHTKQKAKGRRGKRKQNKVVTH